PGFRKKAEEHLGVCIQEIDLRWGITEEQAKRGEVVGLCLDGIESAKPYFVCMIGKRYGWIPAPPCVRRHEFETALQSTALNDDERSFLSRCYTLSDISGRIYSLDVGIANKDKDKSQQLL